MSIIEKLGITPGPWRNSEGMTYIFADRIGGVSMTKGQMTVANVRGWGCLQYLGEEKAIAEQKANEYLIAAAPEMLEALIEAMIAIEYVSDYDIPICTKDNVITAIGKATGKTWPEIKVLYEE